MDLITEVNNSLVQRGVWNFTPLLEPIPLSEQSWPKGTVPFVSICCITYNHENFIQEAIDGFLMQKTTFPVEILIHDDASSDKTVNHLKNYSEKYPNLIKLICQVENQYSKGLKPFLFIFKRAKGKYIATCEGDDYWFDSLKLHKQVKCLEENPGFTLCFHNVNILYEDFPDKNCTLNNSETTDITTLEDLAKGVNYIASASAVIKADLIRELPSWFNDVPFGDYALWILVASHGRLKYLDELMGTYRIHRGGVYGNLANSSQGLVKRHRQHYQFWKVMKNNRLVSSKDSNPLILGHIECVIHEAYRSHQVHISFQHIVFLLLYSNGKAWKKAVISIFQLCRFYKDFFLSKI